MNAIWDEGGAAPAKVVSDVVCEQTGCKKPTVYNLIYRLMGKGAIAKEEPGFVCRALVDRDEYRASEVRSMVDRLFGGSAESLAATLVKTESVSSERLAELMELAEREEEP